MRTSLDLRTKLEYKLWLRRELWIRAKFSWVGNCTAPCLRTQDTHEQRRAVHSSSAQSCKRLKHLLTYTVTTNHTRGIRVLSLALPSSFCITVGAHIPPGIRFPHLHNKQYTPPPSMPREAWCSFLLVSTAAEQFKLLCLSVYISHWSPEKESQ